MPISDNLNRDVLLRAYEVLSSCSHLRPTGDEFCPLNAPLLLGHSNTCKQSDQYLNSTVTFASVVLKVLLRILSLSGTFEILPKPVLGIPLKALLLSVPFTLALLLTFILIFKLILPWDKNRNAQDEILIAVPTSVGQKLSRSRPSLELPAARFRQS
jgi:hypothetical protein